MTKLQTKNSKMNAKPKKDSVTSLPNSFEEALKELEAIAAKLESGEITLNDTVELCARGRMLHDFCAAKLEEAQLTVNEIITNNDYEPIGITGSDLQKLYKSKNKIN